MSRIMIVDDDGDILRYCDTVLASRGHEVVTAIDGMKALALLETHNVDLFVVDIVMPNITGFDILKAVKKIKHFRAPILMLTARNSIKDVQTCLELGATDYMVKPFDRDVFLAKIESILGMRAAAPEVQFARGSTQSRAEVTIPSVVTSITETGITIRTHSYIDRNIRIKVNCPIFQEVGIMTPPLRAAGCKPIDDDEEFQYEVFVSFIGLDEYAMRKIRRWIAARTISARKIA